MIPEMSGSGVTPTIILLLSLVCFMLELHILLLPQVSLLSTLNQGLSLPP
jgi:hypothetical protein